MKSNVTLCYQFLHSATFAWTKHNIPQEATYTMIVCEHAAYGLPGDKTNSNVVWEECSKRQTPPHKVCWTDSGKTKPDATHFTKGDTVKVLAQQ